MWRNDHTLQNIPFNGRLILGCLYLQDIQEVKIEKWEVFSKKKFLTFAKES